MLDLILIRGVAGAGKSTLARLITPYHNVAADDWFDIHLDGHFDSKYLHQAHKWCQDKCEFWMKDPVVLIAVHNTFTRKREMNPYFKMAEEYGYKVTTIIVENRHGSTSIHGVPDDKIQEMKDRFDIVL